jgi:diaminopimelate decarboxylase
VPDTAHDKSTPSLIEWSETAHRAALDAGIPAFVRLTAEPGRAITAAASITCYTVGTVKATSTKAELTCRTGRS